MKTSDLIHHEDTKKRTNNTKYIWFFVSFVIFFFVPSRFTVLGQEGHPLTGTWTGDVGQRHVTLAIEWDGKNVTGTINPGPDASKITSVRMDPAMWSIHLEADGKAHVVIDGGLANIGSASRTLSGTWTEGGTKTPITLTRVDSQSASSNSGDLPASPAYDSSKRVTLRGTVSNVEWINPRVRFGVLSRDARGTASWTIELPDSATTLERNGWNARSLKIGDGVVVQAAAAAGSERQALANSVVLTKGGAQLFKLSVTARSPYGPVPRW